MDVIIAGAGSIGLLIGSCLSEAGMDVTFYVRREGQAQLIRKEGIQRVNLDGTIDVFEVKATTDIRSLSTAALWIVAVKYAGLRDLLSEMQKAHVHNPVLFVQNGIGHVELIKNTELPHVAFATVEQGAGRMDDRTVSHNGIGMLTIAAAHGASGTFGLIGRAHSDIFPVSYQVDGELILMRKVLINCMINPLTAILEVKNGELLTNDYCMTLFHTLYAELMDAFPEMKSVLPFEAIVDVCRKTARNRSSMLTDRLAGQPMEIETIITAVIRKAHESAKSLPLLTTCEQMLYAIERKGEK
ncbi:ketopantoate reductase family protein [Sporosarcina sp. JAI121]|uniref:ketopantoate reductase family protein n=1 Tax=Sporosarcina sp. JAI121 TaxID=2723064 RepID=UPI0015CD3944|nr:2-dehydropantoate 2-reductase [Sporosarcina sp. JAI121]NYF24131.1 2-dehydropantoate 2-reductase [Sporosarcina sp. JAI121]